MNTSAIAKLAQITGQGISLTFDPTATDPAEAWIATVGLDSVAAGDEPEKALGRALAGDLVAHARMSLTAN